MSGPVRSTRDGAVFVLRLGADSRTRIASTAPSSTASMPPWIGSQRFFSNGYDLHWLTALDVAAWRTFIRDQ